MHPDAPVIPYAKRLDDDPAWAFQEGSLYFENKGSAFPDPAQSQVDDDGLYVIPLDQLVALKLASGMTGGMQRMRDLADVIDMIQCIQLARDFSQKLHEYVRANYLELWDCIDQSPKAIES